MNRKLLVICATSLAGACALHAADGDFKASGAYGGTFAVNTLDASPFVATSAAEIAELPPVAWRKGDTVTATSQGGAVTVLATDAATDGAEQFVPSVDGAWTIENSEGETARIIIPFSRLGDYSVSLAAGAAAAGYGVDSLLKGPFRKVKDRVYPPTAYTGDDWVRDAAAASTVTFTPPSGSGIAATTLNLTGTGATQFTFNTAEHWKVTLSMADGTTREAQINIQRAGFVLIVR